MFKTKELWFADRPCDVDGCDRVVFCDCKNKADGNGFDFERETSTLIIDLTQDLDAIWGRMSRGSCRQPIMQAENEGIKIRRNEGCDEFYAMYCSIARKKRLSRLKKLELVRRHGTLFVAEFNSEIISGFCFLEDDNNLRAWIAGSKRFEGDEKYARRVARASKLIIWRAILYAKGKGIEQFDLGGYYAGEDRNEQKERINVFKRRFGGELATRYVYAKDYSTICKCARRVCRLRRGLLGR
jgi:lipid II:glycine glycyltransferase (peptidoglycan interpeptide bridge formation enzyme)